MYKKVLSLYVVVFLASFCSLYAGPWEDMNRLAQSIKQPSFPDKSFNVLKFGASEKNISIKNTKAINTAIIACNKKGGGKVIVPKGIYITGPITLLSNVNLYLEEGAELRFTTNFVEYLPTVLTRWEGLDCYNYHPLIYALKATNIAITGKGIINGQGSNTAWWDWNGAPIFGYKEGNPSQRTTGRPALMKMSEANIPVEKRQMGEGNYLRAQLINLVQCNTVKIEGVTLQNSPFWVIHPLLTNDITVRNVTIESLGPNSDGCDPESCKNVLIEGCTFDDGDDCIAIKSGRNNDGRRWNIPSENIIVRNCQMKAGHGGVVVGSEISGGYKNLYVENCDMDSPELDRVIRIKSNTCRGGVIENVYVRNIKVGQCKEAVLKIDLQYEPREECKRGFIPVVRNVNLENVTSKKSNYGVSIDGLEDANSVSNINLKNCDFRGVATNMNDIKGAIDVNFDNVRINNTIITSQKISTNFSPLKK
ncbi:MAG: glycoside hydrolase [Bacteroidetes bacterium]|nr:glycoside hydrolase [Bacteroidota bacterium]